ncbi:GNAT family N-acetyltransferase [Bombilactobacillus apium]|uniref:GNAT family N-acetyltransferase n=1 Tax=Bombilactobacillus apium TaxID=2675299 RepID=UPI003899443C
MFCLHVFDGSKTFGGKQSDVLLKALSIDDSYKRLGMALAAMNQVPSYVRKKFCFATRIILVVNHANFAAQALYRRAGYRDIGPRRQGKSGTQFIYEFTLKEFKVLDADCSR